MEDLFFERNIKRDQGSLGIVFPILAGLALLIFLAFFNVIPILMGFNIIYFTGMISFGLIYLLYRVCRNVLKVEYELSITEDSFEVVKIIDARKREDLVEFSIKDCEYIGSVTSDRFKEDLEKADFSLNCTSKRKYNLSDDIWYALVTADHSKYMVVFEYEEDMYPMFRRYNPRGTQKHAF